MKTAHPPDLFLDFALQQKKW